MTDSLTFAFSIASLIIGTCALIMSIVNFIDLWATKRSTHQVQFQTVSDPQSAEEMAKILNAEHIDYERDQI